MRCLQGTVGVLAVGLVVAMSVRAAHAGTVRVDPANEGIRPVCVVKHVARAGGPDPYQFDWPVDPGAWPMVSPKGVLRYAIGAYGAGHLPGEFKTIEDWWRGSDFDFVHFQADAQYGMTGKDIAARNIKYVLDPAARAGRKVVAHVAYTAEMLGPGALAEHVAAIKDHPALYGYDPMDEPSSPDRVITWSHNFKIIRALDPEHPIWLNDIGCKNHPTIEQAVAPDKPDIYSWDVYPVQSDRGVSPESGYTRWLVRVCRERGLVPAYILGNFAKTTAQEPPHPWFPLTPKKVRTFHNGTHLCSPEELRSQVYQCIISGIKTVLWYPWQAWVGGVHTRRDILSATYQVNREVHALTGPILSTCRVPITIEAPQVKTVWTHAVIGMGSVYQNDLYIIVANIAEQPGTKPPKALALKGVRIVMDKVPAAYRRLLADQAEVLFEIAGKDAAGVPIYVKEKAGTWRTVGVHKLDRDGKPAVRFQPGRGRVWGPEWTGGKREPTVGTEWTMWEGPKARMYIVDDFAPLAVHIYRIRIMVPK